MEEKEWVDFKEVKQAVSMQMVLDRYNITGLKKVGDELRGPCPIHKGASSSRHFCASITKNAFKCFASDCKARGNVLDFVAAMENSTVRDAALKLSEWFKVGESEPVPATGGKEHVAVAPVAVLPALTKLITAFETERQTVVERLTFLDESLAALKAVQNSVECT